MSPDSELLRRYVDDRSEAAFAELVRRHVNLVYFAALRQVGGDAHRAQDVAQSVFTDLARKARSLAGRETIVGWLHTSTRYAATKARRADFARQKNEHEATTMNALLHDSDSAAEWERLRPTIDEAIHALDERDREAVLLRFFENRPFAEIGVTLRVSEDAARMRVDRALDKLRAVLMRRGVNSTSAALAAGFANQAGASAPSGLAGSITSAALSSAVVTTGFFMSATTAILGVVALSAVGTSAYEWNRAFRAETEFASLAADRDALSTQLRIERQRTTRLSEELASSRSEIERVRSQPARVASSQAAVVSTADVAQSNLVRDRILANLRQIASARAQFGLEQGHPPSSIDDLVRPEPDKYIKRLVAVKGESYAGLSMSAGQMVVTTPDGITATYDLPEVPIRPSPRLPGRGGQVSETIRREVELGTLVDKFGPSLLRAAAAYRSVHGRQIPANMEAYIPYFETPQEGADFLEFLSAQKAAKEK